MEIHNEMWVVAVILVTLLLLCIYITPAPPFSGPRSPRPGAGEANNSGSFGARRSLQEGGKSDRCVRKSDRRECVSLYMALYGKGAVFAGTGMERQKGTSALGRSMQVGMHIPNMC